MAFMISSAHRTASAIALIVAGTLFPPSNWASLRAASMLAAINSTRLRPSSTSKSVSIFVFCSPLVWPVILARDWPALRVFRGV